jgi:HEAT repeat protein
MFDKHTAAREARDRGDVEALIAMLGETDRTRRLAAVANLGDPQFLRASLPLLRCLQAADENLRIGALRALAEIGDSSTAGEIAGAAAEDDSLAVRVAAMEALATMRDQRAVLLIQSALSQPQPKWRQWFRRWAAKKLVELDATEAIPDLEAARRGASPITRWRLRVAVRQLQRASARS